MGAIPASDPGPSAATGHLVLALDTGSPVTSVALGRGETILAHATSTERHSSERLLTLISQVLHRSGVEISALDGVIALRGPGSFTGLRIGLATAWGLHQALGVAATAVPSLDVLAQVAAGDEAVALVDALRDEWVAQRFRRRGGVMEPVDDARRVAVEELQQFAPWPLVGFGLASVCDALPPGARPPYREPSELATHALRRAALQPPEWDPATLTQPIYYRQPAAKRALP